jgi:hypothetical protein
MQNRNPAQLSKTKSLTILTKKQRTKNKTLRVLAYVLDSVGALASLRLSGMTEKNSGQARNKHPPPLLTTLRDFEGQELNGAGISKVIEKQNTLSFRAPIAESTWMLRRCAA